MVGLISDGCRDVRGALSLLFDPIGQIARLVHDGEATLGAAGLVRKCDAGVALGVGDQGRQATVIESSWISTFLSTIWALVFWRRSTKSVDDEADGGADLDVVVVVSGCYGMRFKETAPSPNVAVPTMERDADDMRTKTQLQD